MAQDEVKKGRQAVPTPRPWEGYADLIWSPKGKSVIAAMCEPRGSRLISYAKLEITSPDLDEAYANRDLIIRAVNAYREMTNPNSERRTQMTSTDKPTIEARELIKEFREKFDYKKLTEVAPSLISRLADECERLRVDRDELSETIEACHKMLDQFDDDYEEGTTSLTPLDTRLREYIWPEGTITDNMVNGDD